MAGPRMGEEELAAYLKKRGISDPKRLQDPIAEKGNKRIIEEAFKTTSRVVAHVQGKKNQTELRYEKEYLWPKFVTEEIKVYRFEKHVFDLDGEDSCTYRPDFEVVWASGLKQFIEIKGEQIWEDSIIKFKWAAQQFPEYSWQMWEWVNGKWKLKYDR